MTVDNLLVCKNGVATWTPVYRRLFAVCQAVFVKFAEQPLCPAVVFGGASDDFVIPIEHCADVFELFFHNGNVVEGGVLWVNTSFDGVVFRRQTKRVKAHWLEHVFALHDLVARVTICQTVVIPVTDVQFCATWVGKHFQNVVLVVYVLFVKGIHLLFIPKLIPLFFYLNFIHSWPLNIKYIPNCTPLSANCQ